MPSDPACGDQSSAAEPTVLDWRVEWTAARERRVLSASSPTTGPLTPAARFFARYPTHDALSDGADRTLSFGALDRPLPGTLKVVEALLQHRLPGEGSPQSWSLKSRQLRRLPSARRPLHRQSMPEKRPRVSRLRAL